MEKIFKEIETPTMRKTTIVKYKSIDGMYFLHESNCIHHENNCIEWKNMYLKLNKFIPRAYSLEELKKKLDKLESKKEEWMQSSLEDWHGYNANVYGLKMAIQVISQKGD